MKITLLLAATALIIVWLEGRAQVQAPAPQAAVVDRFEAHGEDALQTLLRFGVVSKVPLGLVLTDSRLCTTKITLSVQSEPALSIVDQLTKQIDGYHWAVQDGVVVIKPGFLPASTSQLLSTVIPRYSVPRTTLAGLDLFLVQDLRAVFHPELGSAGSLMSSPDAFRVGPFEMLNATLEQILDRIVKEAGGEWVLLPTPDNFRNVSDLKFASLISYTDNPMAIAKTSCAQ
jgi:hypothetical protein